MSSLKKILSKSILFENKLDSTGKIVIEDKPLKISWDSNYKDLELIADKIEPFEFGIDYDLGVRTFAKSITELWTVRGKLDKSNKIDNYRATIGWDEKGHNKLLIYREILITEFGKPDEESDNFSDFKLAKNSWGPFNLWKINSIEILLWGSDFRGSFWYKLDINKKS